MLTSIQRTLLRRRIADECDLISLPNPTNWNSKNKTPEELAEIKDRALREVLDLLEIPYV